ncbi:MAG: hypothetical protein ACO4AI_00810 [Prochlorothrix sp.]
MRGFAEHHNPDSAVGTAVKICINRGVQPGLLILDLMDWGDGKAIPPIVVFTGSILVSTRTMAIVLLLRAGLKHSSSP